LCVYMDNLEAAVEIMLLNLFGLLKLTILVKPKMSSAMSTPKSIDIILMVMRNQFRKFIALILRGKLMMLNGQIAMVKSILKLYMS